MKRLLWLAVRLYPAWWRQRYARELEALLEDMKPGWRELVDVVTGAVEMHIKSLAAIPIICMLAGAIVGGVMAMRTPELFASSATIRLTAPDPGGADSTDAQEVRATLVRAIAASGATKVRTLVTAQRGSTQSGVKVTYLDRDPARSQQGAEKLTAAFVAESRERGASIEILEPPQFSPTPITPDYPVNVASGGGVGLLTGAIVSLFLRFRRK